MLPSEDPNIFLVAQARASACISTSKSLMKFCASPRPRSIIPTSIQVLGMLQQMNVAHRRHDAYLEKAKKMMKIVNK